MTLEQFFLLKVAEEAIEVAHAAHKAMQFGLDEKPDRHSPSNAERLQSEWVELNAMVERVEDLSHGRFSAELDRQQIAEKLQRVEHFLAYSIRLGEVAL